MYNEKTRKNGKQWGKNRKNKKTNEKMKTNEKRVTKKGEKMEKR